MTPLNVVRLLRPNSSKHLVGMVIISLFMLVLGRASSLVQSADGSADKDWRLVSVLVGSDVNHDDVYTYKSDWIYTYKEDWLCDIDFSTDKELLKEALQVRTATLGEDSSTLQSLQNLLSFQSCHGRIQDALSMCKAALASMKNVHHLDQAFVADLSNNLAEAYMESRPDIENQKADAARDILSKALDLIRMVHGGDIICKALPLDREQNGHDIIERALLLNTELYGPNHPNTARPAFWLADFYHYRGNLDKAIPLYEQAKAVFLNADGADRETLAALLCNEGCAYADLKNYGKSVQLLDQAVSLARKINSGYSASGYDSGEKSARTIQYSLRLAFHCEQANQHALAEQILQRCLNTLETKSVPCDGQDSKNLAMCWSELSEIYRRQGKQTFARSSNLRALAIKAEYYPSGWTVEHLENEYTYVSEDDIVRNAGTDPLCKRPHTMTVSLWDYCLQPYPKHPAAHQMRCL